jgi:hypothetical protein
MAASAAKLRERGRVEKREDFGMTNDKFPMTKEIRIPKLETIDRHPKFRVSYFGLASDFVIRQSDFRPSMPIRLAAARRGC